MNHIEYSALNYYHSPISDECLCLGVLFHNITTGQRDFRYVCAREIVYDEIIYA